MIDLDLFGSEIVSWIYCSTLQCDLGQCVPLTLVRLTSQPKHLQCLDYNSLRLDFSFVVVALTDATIADQPRGAALRSACVAALPRPSCVEPTLTNGLERASGVRVELSRTMLAAAASDTASRARYSGAWSGAESARQQRRAAALDGDLSFAASMVSVVVVSVVRGVSGRG